MTHIYLGLAIHSHQPVGNFDWVFEQAYQQAYLPLVAALERHPQIRLSLHYSGPLLDWLQQYQPDFLRRLADLVKRGQVEIMTGAYYEPILPSIPDTDKIGQIGRMNTVVKELFHCTPTGLWLPERVWEPHLPLFTAANGIVWTVVDDTHFKMTGIRDADLFGYYVTEEQGYSLKIFATSKQLRYSIPWKSVDEVITFLRSEASDGGPKIAVMGDDGEKFGVWPGTYRLCWEKGWMESFFKAIEDNAEWLKTIPLGEFATKFPPSGRIYLPTASYAEMLEWALPPTQSYEFAKLFHQLEQDGREDITRFMWGGFWRNFLVKYPEINTMHKKMLRVHDKVWTMLNEADREKGRAQRVEGKFQEALNELWRGQCNCPYWHGVFGGVYLNHIRTATYQHLLAAENIADAFLHEQENWLTWQETDLDCDGLAEILLETDRMNLYFDLADGGSLFELDWRPHCFNLTATLTRRPEAYHRVLLEMEAAQEQREEPAVTEETKTIHEIVRVKQARLAEHLHYDWYRRACLIDHFLPLNTSLKEFAHCNYEERGDFVNQPYEFQLEDGNEEQLHLQRHGHVWQQGTLLPLSIEKAIRVSRGSDVLSIDYKITNTSDQSLSAKFGVEWNFNLLGTGKNDNAFYAVPMKETPDQAIDLGVELNDITSLHFGNRRLGLALSLEWSDPATLWTFSVDSVSNSESGFELVHQGVCLFPHWTLKLGAGRDWQVRINLFISKHAALGQSRPQENST